MPKQINKHAMYDAIARHTQAFPTGFTTAERVAVIMTVKKETDLEIEKINLVMGEIEKAQIEKDEVANLVIMLPIWEQELIEELAGHNRVDVITELEANIASVPTT